MSATNAKTGASYGRQAGGVGARGWTPAILLVTGLGAIGVVGAAFALIAEQAPPRRLTDPQAETVYSTGVAVVKPANAAAPPPPRTQFAPSSGAVATARAKPDAAGAGYGATSDHGAGARVAPGGGAMVVYAAPAAPRLVATDAPAAAPKVALRLPAAPIHPDARAERLARPDVLLAQGALIPVTLETALNSDLPGPIRGIVAADVLSFDASRVLIPKGARLIGEYRAGLVRGRARLFAVWTRVLTPDGVSVALAAPAMDGEGRVGIGGARDSHFFERFGGAMILSLVDAAALAAAEHGGEDGDTRVVINTGRDARRAAEIALENSVNIPPTLRAPAGAPLQAFVTRDVDFSDVIAEGGP